MFFSPLGKTFVTRCTKQTFPCSKLLSPGGGGGVSFGPIQHHRGLKSIKSGYLHFIVRLTLFLFTHIMTFEGSIKSFFTKLHIWHVQSIGLYSGIILCLIRKAID